MEHHDNCLSKGEIPLRESRRSQPMNQSGRSYGVTVLRGVYLVLCSTMLLFVMGAQAQAQSMPTRHVRQDVISGKAAFLNRLPATQTLRLDLVLPLRDEAGLEKFLQ